MFDAIVHRRIDPEGLEFDVRLADVEALNAAAFAGEADVTKLSFHAYAYCADRLRAARRRQRARPRLRSAADLEARRSRRRRWPPGSCSIAIPGKYTTANFLLRPGVSRGAGQDASWSSRRSKPAVLDGRFDAGLIIHENRFTYEAKGLKKIIDLGEFWEAETGAPIPLGGIVVKRVRCRTTCKQAVNRVMRRSVEYAFAHRDGEPAVRARPRAGDERRGDVQAHRPLRESVLGGPRAPRGGARSS